MLFGANIVEAFPNAFLGVVVPEKAFPRWPTFGINLEEFHPDYPKDLKDEENNVWMMKTSGSGTSDRWRRFPEQGPGAIGGYIGAVLDAIRNWHDNTQMAVPGFRDRIAHVKLSSDEGGLNLKMDPAKVAALSERGKCAAVRLRERFGVAGATRTGLNWNTHRWVRFRTSMMLLQKMLRQTAEAFASSDQGYPSYYDLVNRTEDEDPVTGSWWPRTPSAYSDSTRVLEEFAAKFSSSAPDFEEESPQPGPELRISPKLEGDFPPRGPKAKVLWINGLPSGLRPPRLQQAYVFRTL